MYDLVGAYYVDTGMESQLKKTTFWSAFGDVMGVVGIVAGGMSIVKGLGAPTASNSIHVAVVKNINNVVVNNARKPSIYKGLRVFSCVLKISIFRQKYLLDTLYSVFFRVNRQEF